MQDSDADPRGDRGAAGPAAAAASAEAVGSSWRNDVSRIIKKRKKGEMGEARESAAQSKLPEAIFSKSIVIATTPFATDAITNRNGASAASRSSCVMRGSRKRRMPVRTSA